MTVRKITAVTLSACPLVLVWGCSSGPSASAPQDPSAPWLWVDASKADTGGLDASAEANPDGDSDGDDAEPETPSLCPRNVAWNDGVALAVSTGQDTFGAVTPDELTIVWTAGVAAASPAVYWADRPDPSAPFAAATALPLATGTFLAGALAVSPDGLRMALQAPDSTFFVVSRADRSSAFDANGMISEFGTIDGEITWGEAIELLGDPVFGPDGVSFYYSRYPEGAGLSIATAFESSSRAADGTWVDGTPLNGSAVDTTDAGQRRRPTGVSADARTIFCWDEVAGAETMAWRATPTGAFTAEASIGARAGAQPNAACTAIYYSAPAGAGTGLFMATRK